MPTSATLDRVFGPASTALAVGAAMSRPDCTEGSLQIYRIPHQPPADVLMRPWRKTTERGMIPYAKDETAEWVKTFAIIFW